MTLPFDASRVAARYLKADSDGHRKSVALMKFLSGVARKEGVAKHVYVVGGAVRNYILGVPIKDIDVVVDSVELGRGRDSEWFAKQVADAIPVASSLVTNQYGVAILTVKGEWLLDGINLKGEVIEIANARKESYEGAGGKGKGYKPTDVSPANIHEDVLRREFTFNTLLWRMLDLADGPDKAEIIDLTGLGRAHLEERLIATPVNPDKTFSDDPTRQLRILKFLLRYNLKISPDVVASVKRNAHKLKQMPWEAVANILVNDILNSPRASEGIKVMRSLGILDVIVEMVKEVPPFATFLNRQLTSGNRPVALLLELADLGISGKATEFLTADQYRRFQSLVASLSAEESRRLLDTLRKPDLDNSALIQEFALERQERGALANLAREALLSDPSLVTNPVALNDRVRNQLRMSRPAPARIASRYLSAKGKYDDIDFQPPKSVASEAEKGLKYREKASPSNKGGLTSAEAGKQGIGSGVQRAVNLKNRDNVTPETISKMLAFFARHEKNKGVAPENRDKPWNDKGHVAWLLWGGDAGRTWAEKVKAQMDRADEKNKTASRVVALPSSARVAARLMYAITWQKRKELEWEYRQEINRERDQERRKRLIALQDQRLKEQWEELTDAEREKAVDEMEAHKKEVQIWLDFGKSIREKRSEAIRKRIQILKSLAGEMKSEGWKEEWRKGYYGWVDYTLEEGPYKARIAVSYVRGNMTSVDPKTAESADIYLRVCLNSGNKEELLYWRGRPNPLRVKLENLDKEIDELQSQALGAIENHKRGGARVHDFIPDGVTREEDDKASYLGQPKEPEKWQWQKNLEKRKRKEEREQEKLEEARKKQEKEQKKQDWHAERGNPKISRNAPLLEKIQALIEVAEREAKQQQDRRSKWTWDTLADNARNALKTVSEGGSLVESKPGKYPLGEWLELMFNEYLNYGGPAAPAAPAAPASSPSSGPSSASPLSEGERGEMIRKVEALVIATENSSNKWMKDFSRSIAQQLAEGKALSEKQIAVLEKGFKQYRVAAEEMADLEDACWEGYEAVGMKEKGGKLVPNCVPVKTASPVRVADRFLSR